MKCAECIRDSPRFDPSDPSGRADVISHYLDEHPGSEPLHDVLEGTFVAVECSDCSREFWSSVEVKAGRITAEAYCSDCGEEHYVRPLVVQELTPKEYVRLEGSPPGDSASKQGGDEGLPSKGERVEWTSPNGTDMEAFVEALEEREGGEIYVVTNEGDGVPLEWINDGEESP